VGVLFVGDDRAEDHHDVEVVDQTGRRLARARLPEGVACMSRLHELLAEHLPDESVDPQTGTLVEGTLLVGIETDRGRWLSRAWPAVGKPASISRLLEFVLISRRRVSPVCASTGTAAHRNSRASRRHRSASPADVGPSRVCGAAPHVRRGLIVKNQRSATSTTSRCSTAAIASRASARSTANSSARSTSTAAGPCSCTSQAVTSRSAVARSTAP
jgi:hypothetical protein